MPTCSECRYWDRRGDNADGECRVRAPVFNEVTRQGMWPWTKPDDWKVTEAAGSKDLFVWPDGRTNLGFFDAAVRRAKPDMPFKILKQLIGWNDGLNEDIGPWFGK